MRVSDCSDDKVAGVVAIEDVLPFDRMISALNSAYKGIVKGFTPLTDKDVSEARSALSPKAPVTSAFEKLFKDKEYGDFDKRLVAERFINSLPDLEGLSGDERQKLVVAFEKIGKLLEIGRAKLKTLSQEVN